MKRFFEIYVKYSRKEGFSAYFAVPATEVIASIEDINQEGEITDEIVELGVKHANLDRSDIKHVEYTQELTQAEYEGATGEKVEIN